MLLERGAYSRDLVSASSRVIILNETKLTRSVQSDPFQPNWQETFYGSNYPRLLSIKQKYDPNSTFYALGAVGSEGWAADIGGPLCKV